MARKLVPMQCKKCGTIVHLPPYREKRFKYCSKECQGNAAGSFEDLTGRDLTYFKVIKLAEKIQRSSGKTRLRRVYKWDCICKKCGGPAVVDSVSLKNGGIQSCGCERGTRTSERHAEYTEKLIGEQFGFLILQERTEKRVREKALCRFLCTLCGNSEFYAVLWEAKKKGSCGCVGGSFGEAAAAGIFREFGYACRPGCPHPYTYEPEFRSDLCRGDSGTMLPFDIRYRTGNGEYGLIEIHGEVGHDKPDRRKDADKSLKERQRNDAIKKEKAPYPLRVIWFHEWQPDVDKLRSIMKEIGIDENPNPPEYTDLKGFIIRDSKDLRCFLDKEGISVPTLADEMGMKYNAVRLWLENNRPWGARLRWKINDWAFRNKGIVRVPDPTLKNGVRKSKLIEMMRRDKGYCFNRSSGRWVATIGIGGKQYELTPQIIEDGAKKIRKDAIDYFEKTGEVPWYLIKKSGSRSKGGLYHSRFSGLFS